MTCKCVETINGDLQEYNTVLSQVTLLDMKTGQTRQSIHIATTRIKNFRNGKSAKVMIPTFCPFCGKRYVRKGKL